MIDSGKLTEKLEFFKVIEERSESGFLSPVEEHICTVRAYRFKNRESYGVDADSLFHSTELQFQIRFRNDVEETNIVVYNGNRYRITSFCPYQPENQITIILAKIND